MSHRIASLVLGAALACGCASSDSGRVPSPHSLHGTVPDGALHVAEDGHFVADEDAIRLFDYFLTTEGEVTEDMVQAMVADEIGRQLVEPAGSEALTAFTDYVAYLEEAATTMQEGDSEASQARLLALHEDAVTRLPGLASERPRLERSLSLRALVAETSAGKNSPAVAAALAETIAAESAAESEMRRASLLARDLHQKTAELVARGAGPDAIAALRRELVGADATARLEALDRERAAWQRRVEAYRAERATILARDVDAGSRARVLDALVAARFDAREAVRVRALERSGQLD